MSKSLDRGNHVRKAPSRAFSLRGLLRRARVALFASRCYRYDRRRFLKWSGVRDIRASQTTLRSLITVHYHALEKGLSLKSPRVGFGEKNRQALLRDLRHYMAAWGFDETVAAALNTLEAYCEFNERNDHAMPELRKKIDDLRRSGGDNCYRFSVSGGTRNVTKQQIQRDGMRDLAGFFASRFSIRQFSSAPVSREMIEGAAQMAQKTPSVCNRQAWRLHAIYSPKQIQRVLDLHGGARGFVGTGALLAVTAKLGAFISLGERNQAWIDGGLYAMSLLYALHSLGLGCCALNCSFIPRRDQAFRRLVGLPESESPVLLIAVGHLRDDFRVAQSHRKAISEVIVHHE